MGSEAGAGRRPLSPTVVHILLSLADEERHGYGIKREVEERSGGAVRLGPGTLYEAIQRLEGGGLIEESRRPRRGDAGHGQRERRRYYRLTPEGLAALKRELDVLGAIVDLARQSPRLGEAGG